MLSLSPRFDLFRFALPKDFLPNEVEEKYSKILFKTPAVLTNPIDYLNESIQSINIPGISDILIEQNQHGFNNIKRNHNKINIEPNHNINQQSSVNPLENIEKQFKVTFRINQGLYNYFMLYETIFYQICKPIRNKKPQTFYIELLDENGVATSQIIYYDVLIDSIDGLEFDFNKVEREANTFDVNFKFNNIDFNLIEK